MTPKTRLNSKPLSPNKVSRRRNTSASSVNRKEPENNRQRKARARTKTGNVFVSDHWRRSGDASSARRCLVDGRRRSVGGRATRRRLDLDLNYFRRPPCRSRDTDRAVRRPEAERAGVATRQEARPAGDEAQLLQLNHHRLPGKGASSRCSVDDATSNL